MILVVSLIGYSALKGIIARYVGANRVDFEARKLQKDWADLKKAQRQAQDEFNAEREKETA